jgi:hypothetical protein
MKRFRSIDLSALNFEKEDLQYIRTLQRDLSRLIKVSLNVKKPIAF